MAVPVIWCAALILLGSICMYAKKGLAAHIVSTQHFQLYTQVSLRFYGWISWQWLIIAHFVGLAAHIGLTQHFQMYTQVSSDFTTGIPGNDWSLHML